MTILEVLEWLCIFLNLVIIVSVLILVSRLIKIHNSKVYVSVDDAIKVLNRIHKVDSTVLPTLIHYRVPCNKQVAEDSTIQVNSYTSADGGSVVGFLGILNGIFGIQKDGWGYIMARADKDGNITYFERT